MLKKKPGGVTGRFLGLVAQWGTAGGEGVEVSAPSQPLWHKAGFLRSASRLGALHKGSFGVCTSWSGIPCILGKSCKGLVGLKKCGYPV